MNWKYKFNANFVASEREGCSGVAESDHHNFSAEQKTFRFVGINWWDCITHVADACSLLHTHRTPTLASPLTLHIIRNILRARARNDKRYKMTRKFNYSEFSRLIRYKSNLVWMWAESFAGSTNWNCVRVIFLTFCFNQMKLRWRKGKATSRHHTIQSWNCVGQSPLRARRSDAFRSHTPVQRLVEDFRMAPTMCWWSNSVGGGSNAPIIIICRSYGRWWWWWWTDERIAAEMGNGTVRK